MPPGEGEEAVFVTRLAEDPSGGALTDELREFVRQHEAGDFASCYEMLDHSEMVMEVLEEVSGRR